MKSWFALLAWQLLVAGLAYVLYTGPHRELVALLLAWCTASVWWAFHLRGAALVMRWLRQEPLHEIPPSVWIQGGLWEELTQRAFRHVKHAHVQVQTHQQRLQDFLSALQASPNGVVLLDAQGRIEWCNHTATQHFGFHSERDLHQPVGNLLRDPAFVAYYNAQNFSREVVLQTHRSNASTHPPMRLSVQLHPYDLGRRLMLSRDITALEQADAMRRDFVANVSHEIRTPLTVISGFVQTLQSLDLPREQQLSYLALMQQQAQRMEAVVNDLLTLAKLESDPTPGFDNWCAVYPVLHRCVQDAQAFSTTVLAKSAHSDASAQAHVIELQLLHPNHTLLKLDEAHTLEIAASEKELYSALFNLVSNAVRYTPAGGRIAICWHLLPQGGAEFSVQDTGPGIAPENVHRLTERFYRVDRSRSRDSGGTGLGLAIVKHIAQRHGAELNIQSTLGVGSRFSIIWPELRLRSHPAP